MAFDDDTYNRVLAALPPEWKQFAEQNASEWAPHSQEAFHGPAMRALHSPVERIPWLPGETPGFLQFKGGYSNRDYEPDLTDLLASLDTPDREDVRAWILERARRRMEAELPEQVAHARDRGIPEDEIQDVIRQARERIPRRFVAESFNVARALIDKDAEAYKEYFTRRNKRTWNEIKKLTGAPPDQHHTAQDRSQAAQAAREREERARAAARAARAEEERRRKYGGSAAWSPDKLLRYFEERIVNPRAKAYFKKVYNYEGRKYPVGEWVEHMIANGWTPQEVVQPETRRSRAKTVYRFIKYGESRFFPLRKSEYDYADWLIDTFGAPDDDDGDPEAAALFVAGGTPDNITEQRRKAGE